MTFVLVDVRTAWGVKCIVVVFSSSSVLLFSEFIVNYFVFLASNYNNFGCFLHSPTHKQSKNTIIFKNTHAHKEGGYQ
jgi:hypothetical protein